VEELSRVVAYTAGSMLLEQAIHTGAARLKGQSENWYECIIGMVLTPPLIQRTTGAVAGFSRAAKNQKLIEASAIVALSRVPYHMCLQEALVRSDVTIPRCLVDTLCGL
jgi:hypothetical protein